jgi:hypothetical protein
LYVAAGVSLAMLVAFGVVSRHRNATPVVTVPPLVNAPRVVEPGGVSFSGVQEGLLLAVDGRDVGPLPPELTELSPGEHTLRFSGSDRYAAKEERVTIRAGRGRWSVQSG